MAEALGWAEKLIAEAAAENAAIVAFPESFIPGYPFPGLEIEKGTPETLQAALERVCKVAAQHRIAVILPMDWYNKDGFFNVAFVIAKNGKILGAQTKNQLDPSEDTIWTPGTKRKIFAVDGVTFGIVICHEGFRYPETTRWAARQGAQIVFHPHASGSDETGPVLKEWGAKENPYYEKAMQIRALENTVWFASVNYATRYPESGSALIDPTGLPVATAEYGKVGLLVAEFDPAKATGLLARRLKPVNEGAE